MSFSVNTNTGAMTALQYLNQTQGQLDQTQSEINSRPESCDRQG